MSQIQALTYEWRDRPTITRHSHKEQIEGIEALVAALDEALPCDGGCNVNSGPEEQCSRHGRPVSEVWGMYEELLVRAGDALGRLRAASVPLGMTTEQFNALTILETTAILSGRTSSDAATGGLTDGR